MPEVRKQEQITQFWNSIAQHYNSDPENVVAPDAPEYAAWVEGVRGLLPPDPCDILDVGAGTGFLALIKASLGHHVTALDLADRMLSVARDEANRRGLPLQFRIGDAVAPRLPGTPFAVVTNRHLLWTLLDPERAFANWRRMLRTGGYVLAFDSPWPGLPAQAENGAGPLQAFH